LIASSTCSTSISTNNTYIRNPGYPSSYTPANTGSCVFTISKASADVCQLRLDFETFTGFATTTPIGSCSDSFAVAGQTGSDPPTICGTNTGYHMYAEFGNSATDTISLTFTYGSTTSAKTNNVLTRQIPCRVNYKAPTDCVQYFTGISNQIYSYNFGQMLGSMDYNNCIRMEEGYCGVTYREVSGTTPDAFSLLPNPSPGTVVTCPASFINIPKLSEDGITGLGAPSEAFFDFSSVICGAAFGIIAPPATVYGPLSP